MSASSPEQSKLVPIEPAELLRRIDLPLPAAALVADVHAPAAMLDKLEGGAFLAEAARLLAHALPKREAVWWACMCARHTMPADAAAADQAAVEVAESWVRRPSEALRRAGFEAAQTAGFGSPESWAAMAAFWSGGSMSPPGQPEVPAQPHFCGLAVAGAVALAAVRMHPDRRETRLHRFLESGRAIAAGGPGRLAPENEQVAP